jgi:hypothetical protein
MYGDLGWVGSDWREQWQIGGSFHRRAHDQAPLECECEITEELQAELR